MLMVVGMHRSGTSAVCRVLSHLGVDFGPPTERLPADRWNETGYFENRRLFALDSGVITGLPSLAKLWFTPAHERGLLARLLMILPKLLYLRQPPVSRLHARAATLADEFRSVAQHLENRAAKDPRFCLLLKPWHIHGGCRRALFVYRHPARVCRSLRQREGIPLPLAYRFWSYHIRSLLAQAKDLPLSWWQVDYDRLLDGVHGPEEAQGLFAFAGRDYTNDMAAAALSAALEQRLQHQHPQAEDVPPDIERLLDQLNRWRQDLGTAS